MPLHLSPPLLVQPRHCRPYLALITDWLEVGRSMAAEVVANGRDSSPSGGDGAEGGDVPTYAEAFPPLAKLDSPTSTEAPVKSLPISSVTQVCSVRCAV